MVPSTRSLTGNQNACSWDHQSHGVLLTPFCSSPAAFFGASGEGSGRACREGRGCPAPGAAPQPPAPAPAPAAAAAAAAAGAAGLWHGQSVSRPGKLQPGLKAVASEIQSGHSLFAWAGFASESGI